MRVLIAYDESVYSDAAVNDLAGAGLPHDTEAIVLSVVERKLISSSPSSLALFGVSAAPAAAMLPDYEQRILDASREQAVKVIEDIKYKFPAWKISAEVALGFPTFQILSRAEEWSSDLIVLGSHSRSALGRLLLGSVSQDVIKHAHCSVRVGRESDREPSAPIRLVVGVDGSQGSKSAIAAVARRSWAEGTEVRVFAALNLMATAAPRGYLAGIVEEAKTELQASGLSCSGTVKVGESSRILTHEAHEWGADCIFIGARGISGLERILLGSTSAAVAANASCSVEVVRQAPK